MAEPEKKNELTPSPVTQEMPSFVIEKFIKEAFPEGGFTHRLNTGSTNETCLVEFYWLGKKYSVFIQSVDKAKQQ